MNKKVKIAVAVAAIACVATVAILVLTIPPSGLTIQGSWSTNTFLGFGTVHYDATIFNHENSTANSVQLVIMLFDSRDFMVKTETVDLGFIPAQSSKSISLDIQYSGAQGISRVEPHLVWTP